MSDRAKQACVSCKRGKRGCDKILPICGLCARLGRECTYESSNSESPGGEAFSALAQKVADLETQLLLSRHTSVSEQAESQDTQGSLPDLISFRLPPQTFPPLFFLDSSLFEFGNNVVQKPFVKIPQEVLIALGSSDDLRMMIDGYFNDTHKWLPIVSRTRLMANFQTPLSELGSDVALLLLAMKMIQTRPSDPNNLHGHLFQLTKSFIWYTESRNAYSLPLLQASILLAAFELGNAIYPAAFLTIGFCARLATAMGIHNKNSPQMIPPATMWTEQEERRRVWWAIIVIDRVVSIGKRGHPLVTTVDGDTVLPVDDESWTRGEPAAAQPLSITANTSIRAAPFARLCQASHVLGRVIEHLNDSRSPAAFRDEEAMTLEQATTSFSLALAAEDDNATVLGPSLAVTLSAVLQLYERYGCPDSVPEAASEGRVELQRVAIAGVPEVTRRVHALAVSALEHISIYGLDGMGPFVLDAFYQTAANLIWFSRERGGSEHVRRKLEVVLELLRILEQRWKAAGAYLRVIEEFEAVGLRHMPNVR